MRGFYILLALAAFASGLAYTSYKRGEADCNAKHAQAAIVAQNRASTKLEKVQNETQKMEPAAIDADLVRLSIVRESTDR